jgi:hypothetical protein
LALLMAVAIATGTLFITHHHGSRAPHLVVAAQGPLRSLSCVYTRDGIAGLTQAAALLGVAPRCAMVFDRSVPTWAAWDDPWFLTDQGNYNWASWGAQPGRTLVVTLGLVPASAGGNWRALGATGAFRGYDRTLARNLVAGGLGDATIRLSPEANGPWFIDDLGPTAVDQVEWLATWRLTASSMLSVPGAHFRFDWTVADNTGHVPLAAYYPGNRLVTYIGADIYDAGVSGAGVNRMQQLIDGPNGLDGVLAFAVSHGKKFSIPEWGLIPRASGGDGNDPAFVRLISEFAHTPDLAYQSYFFAGNSEAALTSSPQSLVTYRASFDATGRSLAPAPSFGTGSPRLADRTAARRLPNQT